MYSSHTRPRAAGGDATLTFAKDRASGELVHVRERPTGAACDCVCPGCGAALEGVNAENPAAKRAAHFRHAADGTNRKSCADAARMFAFVSAMRGATLTLQAPACEPVSAGLFDGSATVAGESRVDEIRVVDTTVALLRLSDGRDLVVSVVSQFTLDRKAGERRHDLQVVLPDGVLDLAGDRDGLRKRLTLDGSLWRWCGRQTEPTLFAPAASTPAAAEVTPAEPTAVAPGQQPAPPGEPARVWTETTRWKAGEAFATTWAKYPSGIVVTLEVKRVEPDLGGNVPADPQ